MQQPIFRRPSLFSFHAAARSFVGTFLQGLAFGIHNAGAAL